MPQSKETPANTVVIAQEFSAANQLAALTIEANDAAHAMAVQIGYQGAMTVGALEDEIRFYQRRTVEAILETGKRLLVLKELTAHGEFAQRVEMLGFARTTAFRFMQAAAKTAKSSKLEQLSTQVKSASAFLELVTHDDDVLENLTNMDAVEKMSASQLRAALRDAHKEKEASEKLMADKNAKIDRLEHRIQIMSADEVLEEVMKEATTITRDALGAIRGGVRQALTALNDVPAASGTQSVFMAGLVGQIQADLNALREEFNLPDVSNAADAQLAGEVAQWAE
ncbi:hypothetical protein [Simplicispira psychrophila]|uniref:hypothetical protein n=1 Tax=Simplicispira psychrophila TaxID=80882 RepID=UPI001FDF5373|nr:hypothetical protein [Simplicispira psychrophila]